MSFQYAARFLSKGSSQVTLMTSEVSAETCLMTFSICSGSPVTVLSSGPSVCLNSSSALAMR